MTDLSNRKQEYEIHQTNGIDFYNNFRSQLTIDIEEGTKTLEDVLEIQNKLHKVSNMLTTGDWKSALFEINKVLPNVHLTTEFLTELKSEIHLYITNIYTW